MSSGIHIKPGITVPNWELWFSTSRSSGAGGQHVNKTESRVTLHWDLANSSALTPGQKTRASRRLRGRLDKDGVLQIHAEEHRSQHQNKDAAIKRFAALLAAALEVPKRRIATRPTRGSIERRITAKKLRGDTKRLRQRPTQWDE